MKKVCASCIEEKDSSEFGKNGSASDGLNCWCRECRNGYQRKYRKTDKHKAYAKKLRPIQYRKSGRNSYLKKQYGISEAEYSQMWLDQGGSCKICATPESDREKLSVDHCHESGKLRGLLCGDCNRALGLLKDSPAIIIRAKQYLEDFYEKGHR